MKILGYLTCFLLTAPLMTGCSGGTRHDAPPLANVKGKVTLNGKPMPGGEVRFNYDGYPPRALEVKAGAFSGEVYAGKNRVDIVWEKDGPPHPMDPSTRVKVNAVGAGFSGPNSPFKIEVPEGGATDLNFPVTSR